MPFAKQTPRIFNRENIEKINPDQSGIYGLFREGSWIYVGKGDIRQRLLDHLNGDNHCITNAQPTHWVDEVVNGDPSLREKELIIELRNRLVCNEKIG
ncbi:hypothetical protein KKC65_03545 [Patescibacteria group bacterium]|nr:hypothetical protein [Patescibacteria group bacterium]